MDVLNDFVDDYNFFVDAEIHLGPKVKNATVGAVMLFGGGRCFSVGIG